MCDFDFLNVELQKLNLSASYKLDKIGKKWLLIRQEEFDDDIKLILGTFQSACDFFSRSDLMKVIDLVELNTVYKSASGVMIGEKYGLNYFKD